MTDDITPPPDTVSFVLIDSKRSVELTDVGQADYLAVVGITAEGDERLVLGQRTALGDSTAVCDMECTAVAHEQLGQLPLEYVRRIAIAKRTRRTEGETQ